MPDQVARQDREFDGYQAFWNPAEKPGYSGVCTFSRKEPLEYGYGIDDARFDTEGRVVWLKFNEFTIYNVYFPSGQRGKERVDYKLAFYEQLLTLINYHHQYGEKIIICGDFNTAHNEIDLARPKQNVKTSGFLPEERGWIDRYLENGLRDAYRDLYPEQVQYTWWTYRMGARERSVGWRLDYFMISESLSTQIEDVIIHEEIQGSDHCPVSMIVRSL